VVVEVLWRGWAAVAVPVRISGRWGRWWYTRFGKKGTTEGSSTELRRGRRPWRAAGGVSKSRGELGLGFGSSARRRLRENRSSLCETTGTAARVVAWRRVYL
jgi:hypothetical protein